MQPIVSIIMGSTSDMPIMEKAAQLLNDFQIPFEINALSAHRTPAQVEEFARNAHKRCEGYHCSGRYGSTPSRCNSCYDSSARDWCSHQVNT